MAATIIPDTHRFVKHLVESGMPTEQAEALKTELSDNIADLVTRDDLVLVRKDLAIVRKDLEAAIDAATGRIKLFVLGANGLLGVLIIVLQVFGK